MPTKAARTCPFVSLSCIAPSTSWCHKVAEVICESVAKERKTLTVAAWPAQIQDPLKSCNPMFKWRVTLSNPNRISYIVDHLQSKEFAAKFTYFFLFQQAGNSWLRLCPLLCLEIWVHKHCLCGHVQFLLSLPCCISKSRCSDCRGRSAFTSVIPMCPTFCNWLTCQGLVLGGSNRKVSMAAHFESWKINHEKNVLHLSVPKRQSSTWQMLNPILMHPQYGCNMQHVSTSVACQFHLIIRNCHTRATIMPASLPVLTCYASC